MRLAAATLAAVRRASLSNMTSTGVWLVQTGTKNQDGSDNLTFVETGDAFACNIQPAKGSEIPQPLALRNLSFFKLFVPYDAEPEAKNRVRVDGRDYEIHDVGDPRSPDLISKLLLVSLLQ